jgi:hypothetical protein
MLAADRHWASSLLAPALVLNLEAWTVQSAMVLCISFRKRSSRMQALAGTSDATPNGTVAVQGQLPNWLSGKSNVRRENDEAIHHRARHTLWRTSTA